MTTKDSFINETLDFSCLDDFYQFGLERSKGLTLHFGHGTDNLQDELCWLLTASLGLPFDADEKQWSLPLTGEQKRHLAEQLYSRLHEAIPVPYLINEAFFCDLPFYVDKRVLIPRSPIAELICQAFSPWIAEENIHRVLDLCTGSGCIALAVAHYLPWVQVDAIDISSDALEVANINLDKHALGDRVCFLQSDLWKNVPAKSFDIIVSNPPYVGDDEMSSLPKEYAHEPSLALRAEDNGLALVDEILHRAADYLSEDGILIVEVGNSDEALQAAYPKVPFTWLEFEFGGHGVFLLTKAQLCQHFGIKTP